MPSTDFPFGYNNLPPVCNEVLGMQKGMNKALNLQLDILRIVLAKKKEPECPPQ
jgi:hypothetical protein